MAKPRFAKQPNIGLGNGISNGLGNGLGNVWWYLVLVIFAAGVLGIVAWLYQQSQQSQQSQQWAFRSVRDVFSSPTHDINNIYKPPIQDHLDRFLGDGHNYDSDKAPNRLSTFGNAHPEYDYLGTRGSNGTYGFDRERVARTLLPTHVRPPVDSHYKQVGLLVSDGGNNTNSILPLMGQYLNNDKWRYFTMLSGNLQTKLPIKHEKKSCTSEYGCPELDNDAEVSITGMGNKYKAALYENGTFW